MDGRTLGRSQLENVDVLLVRSVTRVDEDLLGAQRPEFIGSATSGIDHIDLDFLTSCNIPFAYAPGSNANSVVDYVLSAIANCNDKLEQLLAGAEVGIIGYGHVGRCLKQRLLALRIGSRVYDPWLSVKEHPELVSLEEVLACKVVCLHAELTRRQPWPSHHLLSVKEFEQLRPDALFINAGRGDLIDSAALLDRPPSQPALELVAVV